VWTNQSTPIRVFTGQNPCAKAFKSSVGSGDSGTARVFDYALYCRTWACLLCIFVPPPTSLIKVI